MRWTLILLFAFFALPAPSFAAMDHGDDGPAVPIYNAAFAVPHVDVLVGETVTWHNDSVRTHNVNADDGSFASPRLLMSGTFGHRFETPGTFAYSCQLHPSMRGDVGVYRLLLGAASEPAAPGKPYALSGRGPARGQHRLDRGRRRRRRGDREGRLRRDVQRLHVTGRDDELHRGRRWRVRAARPGARARSQGQRFIDGEVRQCG